MEALDSRWGAYDPEVEEADAEVEETKDRDENATTRDSIDKKVLG
jgi:hypothetical protein